MVGEGRAVESSSRLLDSGRATTEWGCLGFTIGLIVTTEHQPRQRLPTDKHDQSQQARLPRPRL
ncbi:hypothetical protein D3C87_772870 [compost metagenome]